VQTSCDIRLDREGGVPELAAVVALHFHAIFRDPKVVVQPRDVPAQSTVFMLVHKNTAITLSTNSGCAPGCAQELGHRFEHKQRLCTWLSTRTRPSLCAQAVTVHLVVHKIPAACAMDDWGHGHLAELSRKKSSQAHPASIFWQQQL
jgi:hypothetical protein